MDVGSNGMLQYFAVHVSGTALRLSRFAPIAQEEALMEFELTPAPTLASWILLGIAGALLAATLLFAWFAWSASHLSVEVTRDALQLRVPLYGRTIPLSHLDLAHALVTDIDPASRVQPTLRTNGIGLPGYRVGWFKLANGAKALLAVTSERRVLYVPTTEGYALLLSLKRPERALAQLRAPTSA
jgi:Bacterial PH domain